MARTYENFDVQLIASDRGYEALFRSIPDQPRIAISFPLEEHELAAFLALFGKQQTRRMESPEFARVRAVGRRLFDTLFTADTRQALTDATREAMEKGHGLRVRLDVSQARDLGMVPWEYMYFQEYDDFVSLSNWTPVVRHLDVAQPLPPIRLEGPLRILVMISDPIERRGTLDVEREWGQLQQALQGPVSRGEIQLHRLPDGQLETLQVDLQRNEYHVFHFIGHGEYSEEHDDGMLALEDARGREVHVPGSTLATYLRDSLSTRLVVLNNCEGAAFESDPFTGSAQSLLRKGIPAVVAMQFEITDRAAIDFARGFYTSVGNGFPVDAALAEARKVIRDGPTRVEFGSPVLYMSADNGTLFIRGDEVEIPDDADATSLTPAVVTAVAVGAPPGPAGAVTDTNAHIDTDPDTGETEIDTGETVGSTDTEETDTDTHTEETKPPNRKMAALAGVGLAVVLGLVLLANLWGGEDPDGTGITAVSTVDTVPPDTTPRTTGTGTEPTIPPEASPFVPWSRIPHQESLGGEGDQFMHDVLELDEGWVAVGQEMTGDVTRAAGWTSADGTDWVRIPEEGLPDEVSPGAEMRSVVQLGDQLVAAGVTPGDGTDAVVWTSADGTVWERVPGEILGGPGNQGIRGLTVWESGVVAVGWDNNGEEANGAVWTSTNGQDWGRATDPAGALGGAGGQRVHDVVAGGPGLVAVGETDSGVEGSPDRFDAEIWVSTDGDVWNRVTDPTVGLSGAGDQLAKVVRAGPDGLIVAGYDSGGGTGRDAALWLSPDGLTWTQVVDREVFGGPNDQEIHGLTRVGTGWVASGWTHPTPNEKDKDAAIWASEDGTTWSRVDDPGAGLADAGAQQIESVTAQGATIVAVGISDEAGTGDAAVWMGQPG